MDWLLDLQVAIVKEEIRFWIRGVKAVSVADVKEKITRKDGKEQGKTKTSKLGNP